MRVKPMLELPTVKSSDDADDALKRIGAHQRELNLIEIDLREKVDALKSEAAELAAPHKAAILVEGQALARFAESQRDEIFKKRRALDLTFGTIGFRASSALKTLKKMTWDQVLGALDEAGMTDCIRIKREVDKDAVRQLPPDQMAAIGCKVVAEDGFYYELNQASLAGNVEG